MSEGVIALIVSIGGLVISTAISVISLLISILNRRSSFRHAYIDIRRFHDFISTLSTRMNDVFGAEKDESAYDEISKEISLFRSEIAPLRFSDSKLYNECNDCLLQLDDDFASSTLHSSHADAEKQVETISKLMKKYYLSHPRWVRAKK